jgi:acetylornithine deacetylase/succinyl-diaminopimelate desuccinylase-like protein
MLMSHTDTVLADPLEWQLDPWSGELKDDEVWGRGALDMKGQVAASAVALASLAREGFAPNGVGGIAWSSAGSRSTFAPPRRR